MRYFITTFFLLSVGFVLTANARDGNFYWGKSGDPTSDKYVPPEKKVRLKFYTGVSFLKYQSHPGLLQIDFPYSRLDTATGAQIPEAFSFAKTSLTHNHAFSFPVVGLEMTGKHCFLRADIRIPKNRRIGQEHLSFGYEYRIGFSEKSHHFSALAGLNGNVPHWVSSVFVRGEIGVEIYKPVWLLDELPVEDTSMFMMGYSIKKSDSDVRKVGVFYEEDVVALIPSLTFGLGTSENRIDFALTISPFIPLREKGGVRLLYKKNNTGWLRPYTWFWFPYKDVIQPGQSGLMEKYDGKTISKTPFDLGGLEIFLRVGFRIR